MARAAAGVSCYEAGPCRRALRLLGDDPARDARSRTTSGIGSSSRDGADTDYYGDDTAALDGGLGRRDRRCRSIRVWALMRPASPGFTSPAWAKRRRHLSDLPRPLPQRRAEQRPADRRRSATTTRSSSCRGAEARGLLPELRRRSDELPVAVRHDATGRQPDQGEAARPRLLRRRPQGRRPAAGLPRGDSASTAIYFNPIFDAGSNHSLRHARTTRRSIRTSAPRRTSRTSSSTPRSSASGSSSTASSTTCRRTARSSIGITTTRRPAPASRSRRRIGRGSCFTALAGTGRAPGPRGPYATPTKAGSASTRSRSSARRRPPSRPTS